MAAELLAATASLKAPVAEAAQRAERIQRAIDHRDQYRWRMTQEATEAETVKIRKQVARLTRFVQKAYSAFPQDKIKQEVTTLAARVNHFLDTLPLSYQRSQRIRPDIQSCSLLSTSVSHQRLLAPLNMAGTLQELEYLERRLAEIHAALADDQAPLTASGPPVEGACPNQTVGARLRAARQSAGHTQEKAVEVIGCHFTTVSRVERRKQSPHKWKAKIKDYIQDPKLTRR